MKKHIFKAIYLLATVLTFSSCGDEIDNVYDGDAFISFAGTTTGSILEGAVEPITITAYASIPNIQSDVTVNFTITTETGSDSDFTVVDNKTSFNFGPDSYTDTIEIMPVNNLLEDGNKNLTITLTSSSGNYTLGFPGPDANSKSFALTIEDDDCLFTLQELGDATWAGSDNVPGNQAGPNSSLITTSYDGTDFLIEGIGYGWITDPDFWEEVVIDSFPVIAVIDPVTGAITIAEQPLCNTTWLGDPQPAYSVVATGQYVSCSETLVITYDILQGGAVLRSFEETLLKN